MGKILISEYQHNIDEKGRLFIPAKLRVDLGEKFIVTRGDDGCLLVYSMKEWQLQEEKIRAMPLSKSKGLLRYFFASAVEVEVDKQGRVLIPANLRTHAGLEKEVVIIGVLVRVEIWSKDKWEELCSKVTDESITASMEELGF